jgi:nitrogen regulatory protein PII
MSMKHITIIVPVECMDKLEACLRGAGVHGLTVTEVQGFGGHANFFQRDLLVRNIRVDIFAGAKKAETIIKTVTSFRSDDYTPAGILVVDSVERLVSLYSGEDITDENY